MDAAEPTGRLQGWESIREAETGELRSGNTHGGQRGDASPGTQESRWGGEHLKTQETFSGSELEGFKGSDADGGGKGVQARFCFQILETKRKF